MSEGGKKESNIIPGPGYPGSSGGGNGEPPSSDALAAIRDRLSIVEGHIDRFDDRLRAVETAVAAVSAKLDLIATRIPASWHSPLSAAALIALMATLIALARLFGFR